MSISDDIIKYYRDRAKEYEEIYSWRDPYRQKEQNLMEKEIKEFLINSEIIDVGCGTGYWTQKVSEVAKSIIGIDINQSVLDIAYSKKYHCPTEFKIMDAYKLTNFNKYFSGALVTFWLSHVKKEDLNIWINNLHSILKNGAHVFFSDNNYIKDISGELITKQGDSNTYRLRTLNDGRKYLIVKNYYTLEEILQIFKKHTKGIKKENIFYGNCFWWIKYTLFK